MKTYKNISSVEQLGIEPGQAGEASIPEDQEARMVARGAIEVVETEQKEPEAAEPETPEPETPEAEAPPEPQSQPDTSRPGGRKGR